MTTLDRGLGRSLLLVGIAVMLLLAAACGKDEAPDPEPGSWYVAIGDSGTSGAGIAPVVDEGCKRSEVNYPSLLAERLEVSSFADVSCGGAETAHLRGYQDTTDDGRKHGPQADALSSRTRLVTLGIGLNDDSLAYKLLYLCIPHEGKLSSTCEQYLDLPAAGFAPYLEKLAGSITAAIETIREKSPKARIVLVDYPRYVPDSGVCPDLMPLPAEAARRARAVIAEVSEIYRGVAAENDVLFADMHTASAGHDVCSDDPWVHGIDDSATEGALMHPYPAYHRAVADRIADLLGS